MALAKLPKMLETDLRDLQKLKYISVTQLYHQTYIFHQGGVKKDKFGEKLNTGYSCNYLTQVTENTNNQWKQEQVQSLDQAVQTLVTPAPARAVEALWPLLTPWDTSIHIKKNTSFFKIKEHMVHRHTNRQNTHIH